MSAGKEGTMKNVKNGGRLMMRAQNHTSHRLGGSVIRRYIKFSTPCG